MQCRAVGDAVSAAIWKAVAVRSAEDVSSLVWPAEVILLDSPSPLHGGSGTTFDWSFAARAVARWPALSIMLAGGLTPGNVASAISTVRPWGVDVASGVESAPGVKDPDMVHAFVRAARGTR
jgi:phosphoribosylanthranilate isomerase